MSPENPAVMALYALAWCIWCLLHSLLIAGPLADTLERCCGRATRLAYNLIAIATLVPLLVWEHTASATPLWTWPFWLWPLRGTMLLVALWLLAAAAKAFSLSDFSGLSRLRQGDRERSRETSASLIRSGVLGRVRHPWYTAGLLLLWIREIDSYALISSSVLSLYLIAGAHIEERRLLERFGEAYAAYRREVPMFVPRFFDRR